MKVTDWLMMDGMRIRFDHIDYIAPKIAGGIVIGFRSGGEVRVTDNSENRRQLGLPLREEES